MSANVTIDPQAIENLRALNPGDNDQFVRELATMFLEDTPLRITELEQSLAAADLTRFCRSAHSIKGSASNLGASALRSIAEQLELQARRDGLAEIAGLVGSLKDEFDRARAELNRLFPA